MKKLQLTFGLLIALILLSSCVKDEMAIQQPPDNDTTTTPTEMVVSQMAQLPLVLLESSGIAVVNNNEFWSHEDSGNENEIYQVDSSGNLLRTLTISNVSNNDWEDLAIDNLGRIYINDAGNNNNNRTNLAIYRIPNPATITGNTTTAAIINFVLEDQNMFPPPQDARNYDIEATIWHQDSLFLFTKDRSVPHTGICKIYVVPAQPGDHVARLRGSISLGASAEVSRVTAADIHPATGRLVLLTPTRIFAFKNYPGSNFFMGQMSTYAFASSLGQIESIGFITGNQLYMTSEGAGSEPGILYKIFLPD